MSRSIISRYIDHLAMHGVPILRQSGNEGARFGRMDEIRALQNNRFGIPLFNINRLSTSDEKKIIELFPEEVEADIVKFTADGNLTTMEVQVTPYDPTADKPLRDQYRIHPRPPQQPMSCFKFSILFFFIIIICGSLFFLVASSADEIWKFRALWTESFDEDVVSPQPTSSSPPLFSPSKKSKKVPTPLSQPRSHQHILDPPAKSPFSHEEWPININDLRDDSLVEEDCSLPSCRPPSPKVPGTAKESDQSRTRTL